MDDDRRGLQIDRRIEDIARVILDLKPHAQRDTRFALKSEECFLSPLLLGGYPTSIDRAVTEAPLPGVRDRRGCMANLHVLVVKTPAQSEWRELESGVELSAQPIEEAKALLAGWARSICDELGSLGIFALGSLVYRDGAQFGDKSDVDLVVVIPEIPYSIERAEWLERLLARKIVLEDELGKLLRRSDRAAVLCSVVAITSLELAADIHKDGAGDFFSTNMFLDLRDGELIKGLPSSGSRPIAERLVSECVRFTQKTRNSFLAVNALGDETLKPFADAGDAAPKAIMRHAAMVQFLEDDGDGDPGAEYDLDIGADRLTVLLHERRGPLSSLGQRFAARRGGRGASGPLSSADQLLLTELILDAAIQVEARAAAVKAEPKKPPTNGAHSTVTFATRFAAAFPGVRGVQWFDDQESIRQRMATLLAAPLEFEDSTPFWWSRGSSNLHISSYEEAEQFLMINGDEMDVRRVAAVNQGSYKYNFVYVEVAPLPPTGLYDHTEKRIGEAERGEGTFPFYWEEYGIVGGQHLVTRSEYDDGSAVIGGKLQSIAGRSKIRLRYVTTYNFLIAAGGTPAFNSAYDERLEEHLNAMLKGEDRLSQIASEASRQSTGKF